MDQLAAKVYFYYGRLHELVGGPDSLAGIRPYVHPLLSLTSVLTSIYRQLLSAQRLAALRRDDDLQDTLLNLLLRNYFAFNLYDQADKLIAKTTFPDTAGNPQLARWMYYVGKHYLHISTKKRQILMPILFRSHPCYSAQLYRSTHKLAAGNQESAKRYCCTWVPANCEAAHIVHIEKRSANVAYCIGLQAICSGRATHG